MNCYSMERLRIYLVFTWNWPAIVGAANLLCKFFFVGGSVIPIL